ncbi:MAG TPA: hypothetical protein VKV17_17590 [Bryobacteraceae bacterium]|nr:hypothetical protein [Bryobacteraceae bacterium]
MSLEQVWHRYRSASRVCRKQLARTPVRQSVDPNIALIRALQAEALALAGYPRALRGLHQMTGEGHPPNGSAWQL